MIKELRTKSTITAIVLISTALIFFYLASLQNSQIPESESNLKRVLSKIGKIQDKETKKLAETLLRSLIDAGLPAEFKSLKFRNLTNQKMNTKDLGDVFLNKKGKDLLITLMKENDETYLIEIKIEQQENLETELTIKFKR